VLAQYLSTLSATNQDQIGGASGKDAIGNNPNDIINLLLQR
jgi:hypothetical protein